MEQNERPYIIAGPCSVESYEQLRAVSTALRKIPQVRMIRAGVWKPRTQPGGFEGLGAPALAWMQKLSVELGVEYCCEVARPEQVTLCQRHGIRAVWIGARTTTNPFMVEELCSALRGSGMSVLVKNPVCPDVRLWIGAIERLRQAGIADIAAVHRGFSTYDNQGYRNAPLWEVAMQLRRQMPDLSLLCDPSHIGGTRQRVPEVAREAMMLAYDGLMVEVHPHPEEAFTDGQQQLTPADFEALLTRLMEENRAARDSETQRLEPLRRQMDDVDHELLRLLGRRMELSRAIAEVKREEGVAVYQSKRWERVVADRVRLAEALGLDAGFVRELMENIHGESVRVQMD